MSWGGCFAAQGLRTTGDLGWCSLGLWLQPQGQRFDAATPVPGAMLTALVAQRVFQPVEATLRLTAKTAGWAPGIAELGPMVDLTLGLSFALD